MSFSSSFDFKCSRLKTDVGKTGGDEPVSTAVMLSPVDDCVWRAAPGQEPSPSRVMQSICPQRRREESDGKDWH